MYVLELKVEILKNLQKAINYNFTDGNGDFDEKLLTFDTVVNSIMETYSEKDGDILMPE